MTTFLMESYAPRRVSVREAAANARAATDGHSGVRYVRSLLVPGDETCFHIFEAPSADALGRASGRAGLDFHRIVEAVVT